MTYSTDFAKLWDTFNKELRTHMEKELAPALTESQLNVIEFIMSRDKVKPSDFVEFLATSPAAVTTLLDRMEKSGLIRRERDSQDKRMVWIHLTSLGESEGSRGVAVREQFWNDCLNRLSAHNQKMLLFLLGKVTNYES